MNFIIKVAQVRIALGQLQYGHSSTHTISLISALIHQGLANILIHSFIHSVA